MIILVIVVLLIAFLVFASIKSKSDDKKLLEKNLGVAEGQFGNYTDMVIYNGTRFILADRNTHRIYVNKKILDYTSFRELLTEAKGATTRTVYREEMEIQSTSSSLFLGKSLTGSLGVGIGSTTSRHKLVTKLVPKTEYVNASYKIQILDVDGDEAVFLFFARESEYKKVLSFLQTLIDENLVRVQQQ